MQDSSGSANYPILFLSSGFLGPNREGNQSLYNTLLGFLQAGYRVRHFSLVSPGDPAFDFEGLIGRAGYGHFGCPGAVLKALRWLNRLSGRKNRALGGVPLIDSEVDLGRTEITWKQNAVTVLATGIEFVRMVLCALVYGPSLFYGHEVSGIFAAYYASRLLRKKCVVRFQGTYVTEKNMRMPVMRMHVAALRLKAQGVVIANDGTRGDVIAKKMGIEEGRLFFRPNGLDGRLWEKGRGTNAGQGLRGRINRSSSTYVAGLFTRFYPYKRVDRSIALLERLLQKGVSLHMAIGGIGPLEKALKAYARERGVSGNITWCGAIPFGLMHDYYRACDVVLHLNDYANTNNQVLESIHLGVPIVALDDGYNSKMFGDCPYALFLGRERLGSLAWEEVERLIGQRHEPYSSPHITPWNERMREEIEWIEGL